MSILADILSSRVRAEVFRLLFGLAGGELHLREMERQSGLSVGTVRQDANKLVGLDLVKARRDGNRLYYRANTEHPLYNDIRSLVLKTAGLKDVLEQALGEQGIRVAFVFGSLAKDEAQAQSDVDLIVIGSIGLREVSSRLAGVSDRIGREINPHMLSAAEFRRRRQSQERFVTTVLASPKLFVVGSEDELAAMG